MTESLLDNFKRLYDFDQLKDFDTGMNIPIIRWLSFEPLNNPMCLAMNKHIYWIDPRIVPYALHFGINKSKKFIQYVRKPKDDETLDFLKTVLQERYQWTDKELRKNWGVITMLMQDKEFLKSMDKMYGFNEKQCKELGIEYTKPIFEKKPKPKNMGGLSRFL